MEDQRILFPVLAMALLTFLVWCHMYVIRLSQAKKYRIDPQDMTPLNPNLPKSILTSGDNLRNLFELPVLFYLAAVLIFITGITDRGYLIPSWLFVFFRCLHTLIHTTYNKIIHRFLAYVLSSVFLWWIWIRLTFYLLGGT